MRSMYTDGTYLKNNPNWQLEESNWKTKQVINVLKKYNLKPSSVCDVALYVKIDDSKTFRKESSIYEVPGIPC